VALVTAGNSGTNYVIWACTNLASPTWVPLVTNTGSFSFTDNNSTNYRARFYQIRRK
jgi:hypothetical protein